MFGGYERLVKMGQGATGRGGRRAEEWVAKRLESNTHEDPRGPWLETMRQERDESEPRKGGWPQDYFFTFQSVVRMLLLFLFLGNLTNNHVT